MLEILQSRVVNAAVLSSMISCQQGSSMGIKVDWGGSRSQPLIETIDLAADIRDIHNVYPPWSSSGKRLASSAVKPMR
jgi:hypothetical protein